MYFLYVVAHDAGDEVIGNITTLVYVEYVAIARIIPKPEKVSICGVAACTPESGHPGTLIRCTPFRVRNAYLIVVVIVLLSTALVVREVLVNSCGCGVSICSRIHRIGYGKSVLPSISERVDAAVIASSREELPALILSLKDRRHKI